MAKFNVVQKRRRAAIATHKRRAHGEPITGKLHQKPQPHSISGKRQRKLLKKWRRDQKEAVEKGLITMEDVEMAAADADGAQNASKAPVKFSMKKSSRRRILRIKQLEKKGRNKKKAQESGGEAAPADTMVE